MRQIIVVLAAAALMTPSARAAEPGDRAWGQAESDSIIGWIGLFKPQGSQPAAKGNGYALGFGWERRLQSHIRYGLELNYYGADYRTPGGLSCGLGCTVDSTMSLSTWGLGARVGYGAKLGSADLYAGAGLGWYFSTMTSTASTFGFPGEHKERDEDLGVDLRAGIGFDLNSNRSLALELRRLSLTGNFGVLSNRASMPIGGNFVLITYGKRF